MEKRKSFFAVPYLVVIVSSFGMTAITHQIQKPDFEQPPTNTRSAVESTTRQVNIATAGAGLYTASISATNSTGATAIRFYW